MARTTKADLEKRIEELEKQLAQYQQWLMESENKYSRLVEEKGEEFKKLPLYGSMKKEIERLEFVKSQNENTIEHKEKMETSLRSKIQELLEENSQLKESLKNQVDNETKHNARGAGRKPMSEEKLLLLDNLLKQGKKEKEICELMNISRATFYRVKKLLQYHN